MSLFNKPIVYLIVLLFFTLGNQTNARDYPAPYRPYSDDLQRNKIDLDGLNEASYAKMSFDDIRLKNAYVSIFTSSLGGFGNLRPEIVAALIDMRKRGDSVTPLLLKLMDENQETGFELSVLVAVPAVGTINLEPYLDYARKVLRERTQFMSAGLAGGAANLLAEHGTKEDAELMEWVMGQRPWLADSVTRKLDELNRRLGLPQRGMRPPLRDATLRDGTAELAARRTPQRPPPAYDGKTPAATPWLVYGLMIFVSISLVWLIAKRWKRTN
jgi:hypothetical protein